MNNRTVIDVVLENWVATVVANDIALVGKKAKIPAKFGDLLAWLCKEQSDIRIVIQGVKMQSNSLDFSCYYAYEEGKDGIVLRLDSLLDGHRQPAFANYVFVPYDEDFVSCALNKALLYRTKRFGNEEHLRIKDIVEKYCDCRLASKYMEGKYMEGKKRKTQLLVEQFYKLSYFPFQRNRPTIPTVYTELSEFMLVADNGLDCEIIIAFTFTVTNQELIGFLQAKETIREAIYEHLQPFLDLQSFFVHIQDVRFATQTMETNQELDLSLSIHVDTQLILTEKYYATIGFYKTMIYNVREKGFDLNDLRVFAIEQGLNLDDLDREQICSLLEKHLRKLNV